MKDCSGLLDESICCEQMGSTTKQHQTKSNTYHKCMNFMQEEKSNDFLLQKIHTNALRTAWDKLKYVAPQMNELCPSVF